MTQGSLRLRLLAGGALSILLALVVAGLFLIASFGASIEAERQSDLEASLDRVIAAIDPDAGDVIADGPLRDPRYDTPLSGVYWQIEDRDTGEIVRSRSLWDVKLPTTLAQHESPQITQLNDVAGKPLIVLSRSIKVESGRGERHFGVLVAEERSLADDPVSRFRLNLLIALTLLGCVWFGATAVQIHYGLLPLGSLREKIEAVRRGEAARLPDQGTGELQPVTKQINELLDAQEATTRFARERAADLAHGLKTPLAILSATSDRLRETGDRANADLLRMLTEQMNDRIDYQLRIARLRYRTRAQGVSTSLNESVLRSVSVLRKGHVGEELHWIVELDGDLRVDMDEHDLMELIGILLENATQWAKQQVAVRGYARAGSVIIVLEDDGIGLSDEQIAKLGVRGTRLDENFSGEGLGLAIAFEIVRLNGGKLILSRSPMGGLQATLTLSTVGQQTAAPNISQGF